ncbi:hypothetical protein BSKO_03891 [Bryopsis sp. KO-2023]|nr:hypothetical protein BSKO_03891 [Bryopsis sp. KO-2023]
MADPKKDAFRKYLETSGVIDTVTKVLVALYEEEEKPKIASDFIKSNLGAPTPADYDKVVAEKDALQKELEAMRKENETLQAKVTALENPEGDGTE